jgi:hypothetical protein
MNNDQRVRSSQEMEPAGQNDHRFCDRGQQDQLPHLYGLRCLTIRKCVYVPVENCKETTPQGAMVHSEGSRLQL